MSCCMLNFELQSSVRTLDSGRKVNNNLKYMSIMMFIVMNKITYNIGELKLLK